MGAPASPVARRRTAASSKWPPRHWLVVFIAIASSTSSSSPSPSPPYRTRGRLLYPHVHTYQRINIAQRPGLQRLRLGQRRESLSSCPAGGLSSCTVLLLLL